MIASFLISFILTFSFSGLAYEVDNFTHRYQPLSDSKKILNHQINNFLSDMEAQLIPYTCDQKEFVHQKILQQIELWLKDDQEVFAETSAQIDKHPAGKDHIYAKRPMSDKFSGAIMTLAGVNSSINLNGQYIGTDKIGHFFNDGLNEFKIFKKEKSAQAGIKSALESGRKLEEGALGVATTGVMSYADMVANYEGLQFWSNLTEGPNPYFQCVNGLWKNKRAFDFSDYVNAGWDEAINCNDYRTGSLKETVQARTRMLESVANKSTTSQQGKISYTCPISTNECAKLKIKYADKAPQLLHPNCLKAKATSNSPAYSAQVPGAQSPKKQSGSRATSPAVK